MQFLLMFLVYGVSVKTGSQMQLCLFRIRFFIDSFSRGRNNRECRIRSMDHCEFLSFSKNAKWSERGVKNKEIELEQNLMGT